MHVDVGAFECISNELTAVIQCHTQVQVPYVFSPISTGMYL